MPYLLPPASLVEEIIALCRSTEGVVLATLYGSRYTGWATADSDLDFHVVFRSLEDFYAADTFREAIREVGRPHGIDVEWHNSSLPYLLEDCLWDPDQSALLFVGEILVGDARSLIPVAILDAATIARADRSAMDRTYARMWQAMGRAAVRSGREHGAEAEYDFSDLARMMLPVAIDALARMETASQGGGKDRREFALLRADFTRGLTPSDAAAAERVQESGTNDLTMTEVNRLFDALDARLET